MAFFGGGGGGSGGGPYEVITSSQTLSQQKSYMVDTSSSAYSVTLPASPANGDYVEIFDRANTFGTNNLTIARNGNNIESLAEDLVGNVSGAAFKLAYADSTTGWQIIPFYGFAGPNFVGASTSTAGTAGVVPAPAAGKNTRALFSDASFGEVPLLPQYKNTAAGAFIRSWSPAINGTSFTPTIKVRYFSLIYVPADGNIDLIGAFTGSAPSPAFNVHIAMWQSGEDGRPSTLVTDGTMSSGTSGFSSLNIAVSPSVSVSKGFYYMSLTSDATGSANSIRAISQIGVGGNFIGASQADGSGFNFSYTCGTSYNQQNHETFVASLTNTPACSFQYV